jgi:hypothetical protein
MFSMKNWILWHQTVSNESSVHAALGGIRNKLVARIIKKLIISDLPNLLSKIEKVG